VIAGEGGGAATDVARTAGEGMSGAEGETYDVGEEEGSEEDEEASAGCEENDADRSLNCAATAEASERSSERFNSSEEEAPWDADDAVDTDLSWEDGTAEGVVAEGADEEMLAADVDDEDDEEMGNTVDDIVGDFVSGRVDVSRSKGCVRVEEREGNDAGSSSSRSTLKRLLVLVDEDAAVEDESSSEGAGRLRTRLGAAAVES